MELRRLVTEVGEEIAHRLEIAEEFFDLARGLLGRSSLPPGEGILLSGCWNIHMFFMKFPIDVIYVDRDMEVLKVVPELAPWTVSACPGAHSTIELGSGTLERRPVRRGERLHFLDPVDAAGARTRDPGRGGG